MTGPTKTNISNVWPDLQLDICSCPFDRVTIYDGPDNLGEKIGTYCGQMRNLVVFSTKNLLYVSFTTLKRTAQVFNRGFFGLYDFSDEYVKLGELSSSCGGRLNHKPSPAPCITGLQYFIQNLIQRTTDIYRHLPTYTYIY